MIQKVNPGCKVLRDAGLGDTKADGKIGLVQVKPELDKSEEELV